MGLSSALVEPDLGRKATQILTDFFTNPANTETKLNLSACNLQSLPNLMQNLIKNHPKAASRLTLLNLAHNQLTSLPPWLRNLPNLQILFLLNNRFMQVPDIVCRLSSLTMLSFKENQLKGILEARMLPPNLTWLILTSNQLTGLSDDFPERCCFVRKLMLSNNQLDSLPISFGVHMKRLELLRLANNHFQKMPTSLAELPLLTWLSLAGNPCAGGAKTLDDIPSKFCVNLEEDYKIDWKNPFGSGTSGMAFPGICKPENQKVAVKRFVSLSGSDGRAIDEISISMTTVGVRGLVQAKGFYGTKKENKDQDLYLITERVPGDVKTIAGPPSFESCVRSVYNKGIILTEEQANLIVGVVNDAVLGLLERGISHGDVYGHNVLLGENKNGQMVVFLGDLGAAWHFPEYNRDTVTKMEMRALQVFRDEVYSLVSK